MKNEVIEPRLYIIMREDIWDMNPGKGMAQAAHAAEMFADDMVRNFTGTSRQFEEYDAYRDWKTQSNQGYGTTLVLTATLDVIEDICAGVVVDPTYPFRNHYGKVFTCEAATCGYVFVHSGTDPGIIDKIKSLPLHP